MFRYLNIYNATVPDRMHALDLGLFRYNIQFTREMLARIGGQEAIKVMDERLGKIPRFTNLKLFKTGLADLKRFTANDYRNMMKVMVFVVEGILDESTEENTELIHLFIEWNDMYLASRRSSYTDKQLHEFQVRVNTIII